VLNVYSKLVETGLAWFLDDGSYSFHVSFRVNITQLHSKKKKKNRRLLAENFESKLMAVLVRDVGGRSPL
jgi:hypothetical protein